MNHRPLGYEPNELPDCSTPQSYLTQPFQGRQAHSRIGANSLALPSEFSVFVSASFRGSLVCMKKVLIVDDDPSILKLASMRLGSDAIEMLTARGGAGCLFAEVVAELLGERRARSLVRFWETPRSIATLGPATVKYEGLRPAPRFGAGEQRLIPDAGTGSDARRRSREGVCREADPRPYLRRPHALGPVPGVPSLPPTV